MPHVGDWITPDPVEIYPNGESFEPDVTLELDGGYVRGTWVYLRRFGGTSPDPVADDALDAAWAHATHGDVVGAVGAPDWGFDSHAPGYQGRGIDNPDLLDFPYDASVMGLHQQGDRDAGPTGDLCQVGTSFFWGSFVWALPDAVSRPDLWDPAPGTLPPGAVAWEYEYDVDPTITPTISSAAARLAAARAANDVDGAFTVILTAVGNPTVGSVGPFWDVPPSVDGPAGHVDVGWTGTAPSLPGGDEIGRVTFSAGTLAGDWATADGPWVGLPVDGPLVSSLFWGYTDTQDSGRPAFALPPDVSTARPTFVHDNRLAKNPSALFRITVQPVRYRYVYDAPTPLRWRQRNDGMSVGALRHIARSAPTSRQASIRHIGSFL